MEARKQRIVPMGPDSKVLQISYDVVFESNFNDDDALCVQDFDTIFMTFSLKLSRL